MSLKQLVEPLNHSEFTHFQPRQGINTPTDADIPNDHAIGIVGVFEADANRMREQLYRFDIDFPEESFIDYGNLIRPHVEDLQETIQLLLERGVIPVIIGRKAPDQLMDGTNGFTFRRPVHVRPSLPDYLLRPINGRPHFGAYGIVGIQRHLVADQSVVKLREEEIEVFNLGDVRRDIRQIEPLMRESDSCFISLNSVRHSDCPGKRDFSPSGMFAEEICQITRYAGYSEEVQCLHLYDYLSERDSEGQSAHLLAQLIWYFAEGVSLRFRDRNTGPSAFLSYVIEDSPIDYTLTFVHSELSGRWWFTEGEIKDFNNRSEWKACSELDYRAAAKGEITDRLFRTIRTA